MAPGEGGQGGTHAHTPLIGSSVYAPSMLCVCVGGWGYDKLGLSRLSMVVFGRAACVSSSYRPAPCLQRANRAAADARASLHQSQAMTQRLSDLLSEHQRTTQRGEAVSEAQRQAIATVEVERDRAVQAAALLTHQLAQQREANEVRGCLGWGLGVVVGMGVACCLTWAVQCGHRSPSVGIGRQVWAWARVWTGPPSCCRVLAWHACGGHALVGRKDSRTRHALRMCLSSVSYFHLFSCVCWFACRRPGVSWKL